MDYTSFTIRDFKISSKHDFSCRICNFCLGTSTCNYIHVLRETGRFSGISASYEIRTFMYKSHVEGSMFIVGLFFRDLHNSLSFNSLIGSRNSA